MLDSTILIWSLIVAAIFWCVVLWLAYKDFNNKIRTFIFIHLWLEHWFVSVPIKLLTGRMFEDNNSGSFISFPVNILGMALTLFLNLLLTVFVIYSILYLTIKP